jgi:hypothetical protein
MTSWRPAPGFEQRLVGAEDQSSRQMAGAFCRSSMDSKSGTGCRPGSESPGSHEPPSTRTPPRRPSQETLRTSSAEVAPLMT